MPLVSVIIPTFNRRDLLEITLQNIFKQTLQDFEVIVVDDHSTDGTLEMLQSNYLGKVTALTNNGKGPGAARNAGLAIAKGKYIQFFDSDDVMTNNKLEVQVNLLEKSGKDCIYCPYIYASQDKNGEWQPQDVIIQYKPVSEKKSLQAHMCKGFFTVIPGFLFRRTFLDQIGFWRDDITAYEDWDYLWRIGQLCPSPLHTNECAVFYRLHQQQTTGVHFNDLQRDKDKVRCLSDIYNNLNQAIALRCFDRLSFEIFFEKALQCAEIQLNEWPKLKFGIQLRTIWKYYLRLANKIGRIKTGTAWQPEHGVLKGKNSIVNYKAKI
jgi:glycosyltransferase involved in cell wall biosynthesis